MHHFLRPVVIFNNCFCIPRTYATVICNEIDTIFFFFYPHINTATIESSLPIYLNAELSHVHFTQKSYSGIKHFLYNLSFYQQWCTTYCVHHCFVCTHGSYRNILMKSTRCLFLRPYINTATKELSWPIYLNADVSQVPNTKNPIPASCIFFAIYKLIKIDEFGTMLWMI